MKAKLFATGLLSLFAACAAAQNVKITPIGTHPGELCSRDRAMIFEDPTGVRILYDAGQSVTGGNDPRDPLESFNRAMFSFNDGVDKVVLKPAAEGYRVVFPSMVRTGVANFFPTWKTSGLP